ncbi:MAG: cation:proton antiporter [Thaumarchaeota archaeon]|nr:cation:proton antiporter [Nitrososphaerota archaeon]MCL5318735.1 cation:proton antiporter [Nitrososphaerota archaeon]
MPAAAGVDVLGTVVVISVIIFVAKILGDLCQRVNVPAVIGEISAGIFLGPYALGGTMINFGLPAVEFNVLLSAFAQIGSIIILFAAGLQITFGELRATGLSSFTVAASGVVVPFFSAYFLAAYLGYEWHTAVLLGVALTATSIAVTVTALEELGKMGTGEAKIIVNAAVIDDVLGLAVLSIATSLFQGGGTPEISNIALLTGQALLIWMALLLGAIFIIPRFINITKLSKTEGITEAAATAGCFGLSAVAAAFGLSPIVGAFAAGMATAGSRFIGRVKEYVEKLRLIFGPIFFAYIGMQLDVGQIPSMSIPLFLALLLIAVASKILGCGLPAMAFLRDADRGLRVGVGMVSRGEVGFIVAGIGLTTGILEQNSYAALLTVIMATTLITPLLLRQVFAKPLFHMSKVELEQ